jgi:hypothetical protein
MNAKQVAIILGSMLALGCADVAESSQPEQANSSSLSLIEHSAKDLGALDENHLLRIDLTVAGTVHLVEFAELNDLFNVELTTAQGTFVLGELAQDLGEDSQRLVLGATQAELDAYFADHPLGATVVAGSNPVGRAGQARIKLRDCDGCVDPTGIGPVICDDSSPCRGTP